jgi:hypothetical protein
VIERVWKLDSDGAGHGRKRSMKMLRL